MSKILKYTIYLGQLSISIVTLSGASLSLKAFVNVLISFSWSFISWFVFVKCVSKLSFATRVSEILCSRAALVEFHETCILLAFCVIVFFTCPRSQTDFERAPGKYHKNRSIFNTIFGVTIINIKLRNTLQIWCLPWDSLMFWFVFLDHVPGIDLLGSRFSTPLTSLVLNELFLIWKNLS